MPKCLHCGSKNEQNTFSTTTAIIIFTCADVSSVFLLGEKVPDQVTPRCLISHCSPESCASWKNRKQCQSTPPHTHTPYPTPSPSASNLPFCSFLRPSSHKNKSGKAMSCLPLHCQALLIELEDF
ncbi:hypothetical protein GOODEAATRI_002432 [Goodea atripinnis]|uniref:Uncharacterized protein n=1 Tax=Goodea atripinnis TaxID=208336 RepID=A0ABV0N7A9_9TELE